MKYRLFTIFTVMILSGCSLLKIGQTNNNVVQETPRPHINYSELNNDELVNELNAREIEVDSLYSVIDTLYTTIDSLYNELEIINNSLEDAKNQVVANSEYVIPDTITFAGRLVDLTSERTRAKFEKIFNREVKYAYKVIPRSGMYFPVFDSVFTAYNIPVDAKYLAVAESHLSNLANSPVGAVGMWQIMPKTGKSLGLKINSFIDERRDIFKATDAAAKFLNQNYSYLQSKGANDWLLAMAAYNAGPGSIARVIREQGSTDFFELILRAEETDDYVWRAIALKIIFQDEDQIFGKKFIQEKPIYETHRIEHLQLKGHYKLDDWAKAQGTSVGVLWETNPWINISKRKRARYTALNDVVLPPGEYDVLVPIEAEKDEALLAKINSRFDQKNAGYYTYHIVKRGDTLYDIARKYNTSVASLKSLNHLSRNTIRVGQKLKLYSGSYGDIDGAGYHTVRRGETLSHIADKYRMPVSKLKSINNLKNNTIFPGQKLLLSSSSTVTKTDKGTDYHIVQKGETLSHIADKYLIPVRKIQAINGISGTNIFPGQKIYLGTSESAQTGVSESGHNYHIIKKGETLSHVADRYLIPISELKRLNNLKSDVVHPGQKILLSGNASSKQHVVKSGESISSIAKKYGLSENGIISKNNLEKRNGVVIIYPGQKLVL